MKLSVKKHVLLLLFFMQSLWSLDAQTYVRYVVPNDFRTKAIYSDGVLSSITLPRGVARLDNYPKFHAAAYELESVLKDPSKRFLQVWVCGSASPDGLWENNVRLAQARTDSAAEYLKQVLGVPEMYIHRENLCEDWDRLAELVEMSDIPCRSQVLEIIANKTWGKRKKALQELRNGEIWDILVRDFFPQLRCVRFAVFCQWDQSKPHMTEPRDTVYIRDTVYLIKEVDVEPVQDTTMTVQQAYEEYREASLNRSRRNIDWLKPRVMAVKTNLIPDAMAIPSLGVEFQLYKGLSVDVSGSYGFFNIFNKDKRPMSCTHISPELRWWFGEHPLQSGSFIGLNGNVAACSLEWTDNVAYHTTFDNPAWSVGITYGCVACLDRKAHWGLEFVVGFGYGRYLQDIGFLDADGKFTVNDTVIPQLKEHFGLTKLSLNLVYRFSLNGRKK